MKGEELTMPRWINFNRNNISVSMCQYSVLWENLAYLPTTSGLTYVHMYVR